MSLLQQWSNDFLHLLFPHTCAGCGSDVVSNEQLICLHCHTELPVTNFFSQADNPVEANFYGRLPLRAAAAGYFFTKESLLQNLVFRLKYKGNQQVGVFLGELMGKLLMDSERFASVDVLVPLPLNPKRQKKRGYNQATCLCRGISSVWNKPILEDVVIRKIYTETQTHMGRINRWQNMDGVFDVRRPEVLKGRHILLIDDVVTTGATLEACGSEILKIPGTTLSIATAAYTIL